MGIFDELGIEPTPEQATILDKLSKANLQMMDKKAAMDTAPWPAENRPYLATEKCSCGAEKQITTTAVDMATVNVQMDNWRRFHPCTNRAYEPEPTRSFLEDLPDGQYLAKVTHWEINEDSGQVRMGVQVLNGPHKGAEVNIEGEQ